MSVTLYSDTLVERRIMKVANGREKDAKPLGSNPHWFRKNFDIGEIVPGDTIPPEPSDSVTRSRASGFVILSNGYGEPMRVVLGQVLSELLLDSGIFERRRYGFVERFHDVVGRSGWHAKAETRGCFIIGQARFCDGGNVRQGLGSLCRRHGDGT